MKNFIFSLFILTIISVSCTQQRNLVYLNNLDTEEDLFEMIQPEYRIQNQDILYIKINTLNRDVSDLVNQTEAGSQQNMYQNEASLYINGFAVDDSGYVEIPVLGKVTVLNYTLEETVAAIKERADKYLKDATITVKLLSFKFTVLGEVNRPGVYRNYNNQLTVLEAIGIAGEITDYGNRKKILVLRPHKEGTQTFRLDLTDKNILSSDGYYMLPNDVVYVEPIKSKVFQLNTPTLSLSISIITTFILILNYIRN